MPSSVGMPTIYQSILLINTRQGLLVSLSAINIQSSGVQTISEEICKLPFLKYLVASYNKLTLLPENIGNLKTLLVRANPYFINNV